MSRGYVVAIDQGTTGTMVLVFDRHARVAGRAYAEITQHYPRPGWVEHDPTEIWEVTAGVVAGALSSAGIRPGEVAAVGITNQRETAVLWDRGSGEPVAPAIVWQDRRTAPLCERLRAAGHEDTIRKRTGLVVDPYFSATKVRWLLENVEGLRRRAEAGDLAFGTIDSWLVHRLTGGRVHATDLTNASRTLLLDIHERRWSDELLGLVEVPRTLLPDVFPSGHDFGTTDPRALGGVSAPVAGIAGDQQAALFGQACFAPGAAKNTYGTGSFVLMNTGPEAVTGHEGVLTTIAATPAGAEVEYALEGPIFVTGAAVQWLRDGLGLVEEAAETEAVAAGLGGNDGVYFVPALTGLGCPHWDPGARGLIIGLTRGTTAAHLVRAALESIAYQTVDVLDAMERESGIRLESLRADGGASANSFLMQFQADVMGRPVEVPESPETTALGAAYLAGLSAGVWAGRDELAGRWRLGRRYEPTMQEAERTALHARWRDAVARSLAWEPS